MDQFTLILLLFAAVDDVVSEPEAGFVNACADALLALCTKDGLSGDRPPLKADEFITKPQPAAPQPTAQEAPKEEPAQEEEPQPSLEELLEELDSRTGAVQGKLELLRAEAPRGP